MKPTIKRTVEMSWMQAGSRHTSDHPAIVGKESKLHKVIAAGQKLSKLGAHGVRIKLAGHP